MKAAVIMMALLGLALSAGCATYPGQFDPKAQLPPPVYPADNLRRPTPVAGSLFTAGQADYFTDLRAHKVGDIITVEIVENAKARKKNDTKAERSNEWKAGIPSFLGFHPSELPGVKTLGLVKSDATTDPLIDANFKSKHDAKAELSKEDSMTASIGCTVMEVTPQGNLFVRGSREIQVNGETQYIVLQGTVRPSDVSPENAIYSTQLADAKIFYTGRGVLTDKQKPGWLARLLDAIWPF